MPKRFILPDLIILVPKRFTLLNLMVLAPKRFALPVLAVLASKRFTLLDILMFIFLTLILLTSFVMLDI